jgi:hypothetical protein
MHPLVASLHVVLLVACANGSGNGGPDARQYGEQCQEGGAFDVSGRVAVLASLNVHIDASGLVEADTTAELLIAMDVTQTGTNIAVAAKACGIKIPEIPLAGQDRPISFEVPEATVASVAEIAGDGRLSSNETCATLETDEFVIVLGALLDPSAIATARLPSADADGNFPRCLSDIKCKLAFGSNCACDQEDDGYYGATLLARNVPIVTIDQVHVAMRARFSLEGKVHSSDLVVGTVDAAIEQTILGCRLAGGQACSGDQIRTVSSLNPVITQSGSPSRFRAVRVPAGTSCADVIAMRDSLFPR